MADLGGWSITKETKEMRSPVKQMPRTSREMHSPRSVNREPQRRNPRRSARPAMLTEDPYADLAIQSANTNTGPRVCQRSLL